MIEVNEAFGQIYKTIQEFTSQNKMEFVYDKDTMLSRDLPVKTANGQTTMAVSGENGSALIVYDSTDKKIRLFGSGDKEIADEKDCKELSLWMFDPDVSDERDVKSIANDFADTMAENFSVAKVRDLSQIKLPKSVSKNKAKSGADMYDTQTLANRFVMIYPEYKDSLKQNILDYGEFLPVDFCEKYIVPKTLEVLKKGSAKEQKKLFLMFNDIYEDGLNEVQDIIAVVILSRMDNKPEYLAIADKYMSDYMKPTIHRVNEMMASSSGKRYRAKMANPPVYKPKKQKQGLMKKLMGSQQGQGLQ